MEHLRRVSLWTYLILSLLVIIGTACKPAQPVPLTTTGSSVSPTPPGLRATPSLVSGGFDPDIAATLNSLEKVDDYPLYVMHYTGAYNYPKINGKVPTGLDFGCSLFAALGKNGDKLYGRNFDWEYSPALLLYTDPPDGYASVSMVDLVFLGMDAKMSTSLATAPMAERARVLSAPSMPFDGMNEYGLTIGIALVEDGSVDDYSYDASRPTIDEIGIIRQLLDHARNVDEAVNLFSQYNIDFAGLPPIHYLLADPAKAVLLEFYQKKLVQLPNQDPWHLATNHLRCIAKGDGGCWRYKILSDRLAASNGQLDPLSAMQLLSDVKQDITQWSVVYDLTTGDVSVVIGQNYETVHAFHLDLVHP